jgi:hypothetical protein
VKQSTVDIFKAGFDLTLNTVSAELLDRLLFVDVAGRWRDGERWRTGRPALDGNRALAGWMIGGIGETKEMLDFCAKRGIGTLFLVRLGWWGFQRCRMDVSAPRNTFRGGRQRKHPPGTEPLVTSSSWCFVGG